jgi:hypothetical protein
MMARKKFVFRVRPTAFGEPGAKRSQDNKPSRVMREPVRTTSVDHGFWSHLSLRSRSGMGLSQAWPLLSRLFPAPLIPARPFGLGWCFDEAPLVTPSYFRSISRQRYQAQPRDGRTRSRKCGGEQSPGSKPNGLNNKDWFGAKHESRISAKTPTISTISPTGGR